MTEQQRDMLRRRLRPTTAPLAVDGDRTTAGRSEAADDDADGPVDVYLLVAV
jgi:hypothetical protein